MFVNKLLFIFFFCLFLEFIILFLVVSNFDVDLLDVIKIENEVCNNFVIILIYLFGKGKCS